jgi:predicted transcriptional regulator
MKTSTFPALRVEPELRDAVEGVLNEDETLSSFMEAALRDSLAKRQFQREFIRRGLASRDEAKRTDRYFAADDVHGELESMLKAARAARESH